MKQDSGASQRVDRRILPFVFGAIFVLSCLALPQYLHAKRSAQWPSTRGLITVSRLRVGYAKGIKGYYGDVRYQYQVGEHTYQGDRLSFNRVHLAVEEAWQKEIDAYPTGKTVNVFYEPKDPSNAVLQPGLHGEIDLLYKMTMLFIAGSGLAFLIAISPKRT